MQWLFFQVEGRPVCPVQPPARCRQKPMHHHHPHTRPQGFNHLKLGAPSPIGNPEKTLQWRACRTCWSGCLEHLRHEAPQPPPPPKSSRPRPPLLFRYDGRRRATYEAPPPPKEDQSLPRESCMRPSGLPLRSASPSNTARPFRTQKQINVPPSPPHHAHNTFPVHRKGVARQGRGTESRPTPIRSLNTVQNLGRLRPEGGSYSMYLRPALLP